MKINELKWKVYYNKDIKENCLGLTDYYVLDIQINPIVKGKDNIQRTVMHEVIHAYLYSYGFTNKNEFQLEEMVEFISHNFDNIRKLTNVAMEELEKWSKKLSKDFKN